MKNKKYQNTIKKQFSYLNVQSDNQNKRIRTIIPTTTLQNIRSVITNVLKRK